jgi:3-oxoacyl-[acyl-carrier protein] reductase
MLRAALPLLNDGGAVVTVSSVAAHTGAPLHAHYAAAKAGLVNLTKSCARALAPRLRVNCVAPGITLTPMGSTTAASLPPDYARTKLLTGRFAEPEEIARCIVFLASPAASFITGATLDANGGRDLR